MDYLTFESFIHPDVLSAFLIKKGESTFKITADAKIGDEYINVENAIDLSVGAIFLHSNIEYKIRAIDQTKSQIVINELQNEILKDVIVTIPAVDYRNALKSFYDIGTKDYSTFANSLTQSQIIVRFDADVYILKRAFIAMYTWILQNKAFLRNLDLSGIGIKKSDIYDHFDNLLKAEREELEGIRKEATDEVARKQNAEYDGKSGNGFVRYTAPSRSYFSGYRR
jgi:hypothetical protein